MATPEASSEAAAAASAAQLRALAGRLLGNASLDGAGRASAWAGLLAHPRLLRADAPAASVAAWLGVAVELMAGGGAAARRPLGAALAARVFRLRPLDAADRVSAPLLAGLLPRAPWAARELLLLVREAVPTARLLPVLETVRAAHPPMLPPEMPPVARQAEFLALWRAVPPVAPPRGRGFRDVVWLAALPPSVPEAAARAWAAAVTPADEDALKVVFLLLTGSLRADGLEAPPGGGGEAAAAAPPSAALALLFGGAGAGRGFGDALLPSVAPFVAQVCGPLEDAPLRLAVARMVGWPLRGEGRERWVLAVLEGYCTARKFTLLASIARDAAPALARKVAAGEGGALPVLLRLLLGYQHAHDAFHAVVPLLVPLLGDGSPLDAPTRARVAFAARCMMYQHPGHPETYRPLVDALRGAAGAAPPPSEAEMRAELRRRQWSGAGEDDWAGAAGGGAGRSSTGMVGLINTGNTCYLNSVLQSLFLTDRFRRELLGSAAAADPSEREKRDRDVPSEFGDFSPALLRASLRVSFAHLMLSQRPAHTPSALARALPAEFSSGRQQDATEFARFVTEVAHADDGVFGGRLRSTVLCDACGAASSRDEAFAQLALPLHEAGDERALDELLARFFAPERLEGDNAYRCDSAACGGARGGATKTVALDRAPQHLWLALKRHTLAGAKLLTRVPFPCVLRVGGARYALYSVVVHSGSSARHGHYYAVARHADEALAAAGGGRDGDGEEEEADDEEERARRGRWFLLNDSRVTASSFETAASLGESFPTDVPYMLMYRRAGRDDARELREAAEAAEAVPAALSAAVNADNGRFQREDEAERRAQTARRAPFQLAPSAAPGQGPGYDPGYYDPDQL